MSGLARPRPGRSRARSRVLLGVQVATLAAFTTALVVHGGPAGLLVDLAGVALAALGLALMRHRARRRR